MHEIKMLDILARKQEIALGFAGLRMFEINNEIEALWDEMIIAEVDNILKSTPWHIMTKIRIKVFFETLLLSIPRRNPA